MRVIITGGGGFCGQYLISYLEPRDIEVHTISSRYLDRPYHHRINDITDVSEISEILSKVQPSYIFHLAGIAYTDNPYFYYKVNSSYSAAILLAMQKTNISDCPIMLVGTCAEYGIVSAEDLPINENHHERPYSHYGISKLAQTLQGKKACLENLKIIIVRPFNAIGEGMSDKLVIQSFAKQIVSIKKGLSAPIIYVGNLDTSRDFIDVKELVRIYWTLIRSPSAYGEIINVCSGKGIKINNILNRLLEVAGIDVEIRTDPSRIKSIDINTHYGCTKKLSNIIGYTPDTDIDKILSNILRFNICK